MTDLIRSILMGIGCLFILGLVGCGMMGAGVMVVADRAAERSLDRPDGDDASGRPEKSPWDK